MRPQSRPFTLIVSPSSLLLQPQRPPRKRTRSDTTAPRPRRRPIAPLDRIPKAILPSAAPGRGREGGIVQEAPGSSGTIPASMRLSRRFLGPFVPAALLLATAGQAAPRGAEPPGHAGAGAPADVFATAS